MAKPSTPAKSDWASVALDQRDRAMAAASAAQKKRDAQYADIISGLEKQLDVALALGGSPATKGVLAIEADPGVGEATAVAVASDWHVEETVTAKSVNNLNEFNLEIAQERITKFFHNVVKLTNIQRGGADIKNLVLVLGGDLMTGYIHEELVEENALSPTETIVWLQDRLLEGIRYLHRSGDFERIVIPTCYGNHGRTTKKPRISTGAKNSYEWLLYKVLAARLEDEGIGEWQVGESYHNFLKVYGWTLRIHHGDGLKYQGGIGGLTIPVEKAIASWNKGVVADLDVFGHWHTAQQNPKWIANGSLIGYNAYALQIKAAYEPPQQTFFLMDSQHGRTITAPIFV